MNNVDHPAHYNQLGFEVWDIVKHLDFAVGNVVKYILRAPFKGKPVEDLQKALWYARHADEKRLESILDACPESLRAIGESLEKCSTMPLPQCSAICSLYDLICGRCRAYEFVRALELDVQMARNAKSKNKKG